MKIAVQASTADASIVRQLLSPWKISFTDSEDCDLSIVYKEKFLGSKKSIVLPSLEVPKEDGFAFSGQGVKRKSGKPLSIRISDRAVLEFKPQFVYFNNDSVDACEEGQLPLMNESLGDSIELAVDVVDEYKRVVDETFTTRSSALYNLLTNLPLPYNVAPEWLKRLYMRKQESHTFFICDKLPIDFLRFMLAKAIERVTGTKLEKRSWAGKKTAVLLTHDVDTRAGLEDAKALDRLEQVYDIKSAWYVPSKFCMNNAEAIKDLSSHGEIGAHDTKHDGRLDRIEDDSLVQRVVEARVSLEDVTKTGVTGFRAPLLQHSMRLIRALRKANYVYDSSVPTWEPLHPRTRKPHGIGTVCPLSFEGMLEIPVTMVQDHQLLTVLNLTPKELVETWTGLMDVIKEIGGLCTFLVHPDYDLARPENLSTYEELLNLLKCDSDALLCLPSRIKDLVATTIP